MNEALQKKLEALPHDPGVYLFKDSRGKVIYVGKAKDLRQRVRSYFQSSRGNGPKLRALVTKIADMETIVTDNEVEALILEANLVKEYKPRYNITLKDDKSYPYIRVTKEEFPRVFITRRVIKDGSRYFGPYTDVHTVRSLLKTVRRIFPIRSCNYRLDEKTIASGKIKLCLDYHIRRCPGPCQGLISSEDYRVIVEQMVRFIEGKNQQVVEDLQKQMEGLAQLQRFEEAARIRDQIQAIEVFRAKQKVVSSDWVDRDVVAIQADAGEACGVIFKVREGKITGRYHFYLDSVAHESDQQVLTSFLQQYYVKAQFIPEEILLPFAIEDMETFEQWLRRKREAKVTIVVPKIGDKAKLVRMAQHNAWLLLEELKIQKMKARAERIPRIVEALQRDLHLPRPPRRIEAFDVSNIMGTDAVASMVSFVDGRPRKSEYRRFKIRTVEGIDDFAMMAEAVERRYRRLLEEGKPLPDLILVDGGKGQLSSALEALRKLQITDQPVIALAKRLDEVYLPGCPAPQNIPHSSPALRLLQRIRDESHRFAVEYHRTLRRKRTLASELDEIKGIGEGRRQLLLKHFGSLDRLRKASLEELQKVPGLPKNLARAIWEHFHQEGE